MIIVHRWISVNFNCNFETVLDQPSTVQEMLKGSWENGRNVTRIEKIDFCFYNFNFRSFFLFHDVLQQ